MKHKTCQAKTYKSKKYTEDDFRTAVENCNSVRCVLKTLGLSPSGGSYQSFKRAAKAWNINTSHFTGKIWCKGKKIGPKRPIEDYLSNKHGITSHHLRLRLIREGIKEHRCEKCNLTEWLELPIPLELDHIDGNREDNSLSNLRLLCPNCHAQTPTYRGKNIGRATRIRIETASLLRGIPLPVGIPPDKKRVSKNNTRCTDCQKEISRNAVRCKSCVAKEQDTKIEWPSNEELLRILQVSNYSAVARDLGVSDNAVRKRVKNHS